MEIVCVILALIHQQWQIVVLLFAAETLLLLDFENGGHGNQSSSCLTAHIDQPAIHDVDQKQEQHAVDDRIHGTWHLTNAMDMVENQKSAAELMQLGGLARTGIRMFKGMEFRVTEDKLHMRALTKLPFLKVSKEAYTADGSASSFNRRDMRPGKLIGYIKVQPDGGVDHYYKWQEPVAGHACDELRMNGHDELAITSHVTVGSETSVFRMDYTRSSKTSGTSDKKEEHTLAPLHIDTKRIAATAPTTAATTPVQSRPGSAHVTMTKQPALHLDDYDLPELIEGTSDVLESEIATYLAVPCDRKRQRSASHCGSSASSVISEGSPRHCGTPHHFKHQPGPSPLSPFSAMCQL